MELDPKVVGLLKRFAAVFPIPQSERFTTATPEKTKADHEERCRQWSIKFAQQAAFSFPGEGYGVKRGSAGRPIGKDTLAKQSVGKLECWDLMVGAGTGLPTLNLSPEYHLINDQVFVPVVATNHLGDVAAPPPIPPVPGGFSTDPQVKADIAALKAQLAALKDEIKALQLDAAKPLTVVGKTDSNGGWLGHTHPINLKVLKG